MKLKKKLLVFFMTSLLFLMPNKMRCQFIVSDPQGLVQQILDYVLQGEAAAADAARIIEMIGQLEKAGEKAQKYIDIFKKVSFEASRVVEIAQSAMYLTDIIEGTYQLTNYMFSNPRAFNYFQIKSNVEYLAQMVKLANEEAQRIKDYLLITGTDIEKLKAIKSSTAKMRRMSENINKMKSLTEMSVAKEEMVRTLNNNNMISPIESVEMAINPIGSQLPLSTQIETMLLPNKDWQTLKKGGIINQTSVVTPPSTPDRSTGTIIVRFFYAVSAIAGLFGVGKIYASLQHGNNELYRQVAIWISTTIVIALLGTLLDQFFFV